MGYLCRGHKHDSIAEESSWGRCGTPGIPALRRPKQELSSRVAVSVDYVGDPVQNKNQTSKPATLSFSVGVAADKLSKHHRWQYGT